LHPGAFPRCKICHKCVCGRGSAPVTAREAYSASSDPLTGFKGSTSKGVKAGEKRGGEGEQRVLSGERGRKGRTEEGKRKDREGGNRKGRKIGSYKYFFVPTSSPVVSSNKQH